MHLLLMHQYTGLHKQTFCQLKICRLIFQTGRWRMPLNEHSFYYFSLIIYLRFNFEDVFGRFKNASEECVFLKHGQFFQAFTVAFLDLVGIIIQKTAEINAGRIRGCWFACKLEVGFKIYKASWCPVPILNLWIWPARTIFLLNSSQETDII